MDALRKLIEDEKASERFVIIYPHWGNEYQTSHSAKQEETAHDMVDAGADLIIGSHPHVVQDSEIYKNKPIFYSLGNFVFDQTFSQETQRGLIIGVSIEKDSLTISFVPVESNQLKPRISTGNSREELIKRAMPEEFINQAPNGIMVISR
jgi:poly-gamma-glutamate synthesis protein (capsule biosynthesis protein)